MVSVTYASSKGSTSAENHNFEQIVSLSYRRKTPSCTRVVPIVLSSLVDHSLYPKTTISMMRLCHFLPRLMYRCIREHDIFETRLKIQFLLRLGAHSGALRWEEV